MSRLCALTLLTVIIAPIKSIHSESIPATPAVPESTYEQVAPIGDNWHDYDFDSKNITPPVWDFTPFFHTPAGKYGFVKVEGEHFVFGDSGERARFWGANLTGAACFPKKEDAQIIVKWLKKWGFNAVRLAHLDSTWPKIGLINYDDGSQLSFNEEAFDRLFYFMAELKKAGIYFILDGIHGFYFHTKEFSFLGKNRRKPVMELYFSQRMRDYHEQYLRKLFRYKNPYTGTTLAEEPALFAVQILNETSIRNRSDKFTTINDFPKELQEVVLTKWRDFIKKEQLDSSTSFASSPSLRRKFIIGVERDYFRKMKLFFRNTLKIRCPLASTSCYSSTYSWQTACEGDFSEGHCYFSHSHYVKVPGHDKKLNQVDIHPAYYKKTYQNWLAFTTQQRIGFQPYIVAEWNSCHPFPQRFDAALWMVGLAQIQDWDGMFIYTLINRWETYSDRNIDHVISLGDPSRMINMIPAAWAWHTGAIPNAPETIGVTMAPERIYKAPCKQKQAFAQGLFRYRMINLPPVNGIRLPPQKITTVDLELKNDDFNKLPKTNSQPPPLSTHEDYVTINASLFQSIWGALGGKTISTAALTVKTPPNQAFSITATSLDKAEISQSKSILVTLGAVSLAAGTEFLEKINAESGEKLERWSLNRKDNHAKIKPITTTLSIHNPNRFICHAVDFNGIPQAEIPVKFENDMTTLHISPTDKALWYLLNVKQ